MEASEAGTILKRGRERSKKTEGSFREAISLVSLSLARVCELDSKKLILSRSVLQINSAHSISLRLTSELGTNPPSAPQVSSPAVPSSPIPLSVNIQRLRAIPLLLLRLLHTRLPFGGPLLKDISATSESIPIPVPLPTSSDHPSTVLFL